MAIVTRTIGPGGGPTYDYASLSAWEAGEQTDLVTAGDSHVAECYIFPSGLDDNVRIDGWVTDETHRIHVKAADGQQHNGTPKSGFYISNFANFTYVINCRQDYVDVTDIDLENTSSQGGGLNQESDNSNAAGLVNRCIGLINSSSSGDAVFSGRKESEWRNCLAYGGGNGFLAINFRVPHWRNCTAANCGVGFTQSGNGGAPIVQNCVAYNNGTNYKDNGAGWDAASTNNATSSATDDAPGPNSILNIVSGDFADAANDDFHLAGTGSALYAVALDQSVDYTDDIDNDTRSQWDIGIDEFVSGVGPIELDVDDLRHARPVDAVDVTPLAIGLIIESLRHARFVDDISALGVSVDLFVASLRHARPVDDLDIIISVDLGIDALTHGRRVDVVDLQELVGVVIDIEDARHGRPVDQLLLDVEQPILIDGLRHARPVDAVDTQLLMGDQTGIGATASAWILDAGQTLNNASSIDFGYHVLEGVFDGNQSVLGVDGNRLIGPAGVRELTALTLGADVDGQRRAQGEIAELRIYAGALSQADRDRITQELTTKWITG